MVENQQWLQAGKYKWAVLLWAMNSDDLSQDIFKYSSKEQSCSQFSHYVIVMACAEGLVKNHNKNLLKASGGHVVTKCLLHRMGHIKRWVTTKLKVTVSQFVDIKTQFLYLFDVKSIVEMEESLNDHVINWGYTGSSWTMAKERSKKVEIAWVDDKRQITAIFSDMQSGDFPSPTDNLPRRDLKVPAKNRFSKKNWHVTYVSLGKWRNYSW